MAEKILNTRILLKYDTYANWSTNNPVLKAGEMAVATIANNDNNTTATGFTNLPNIVLKVGDGTSHYNDLKFVSALAADVHGWAKAASKPEYGYNEITGLEQFIKDTVNTEIKDTDTQYNLVTTDADNYKFELRSKEKSAIEWTKVADLDLSGIIDRVKALEDKFAGMTEATVVAHVQAKIEGLDMAAAIEAGAGEIVYYVNEADGVVDAQTRALVAADIPTIEQSQVNGLPKALEDINTAISNAQSGTLQDAKDYSDSQLKNKVESLDYDGGEFGEHKFVTKVTEEDGVVAAVYAQPVIADIEGLTDRLSGIDGEIANKQDTLTFTTAAEYPTPNDSDNRVVTEKFVLASVADLNGAMHFVGKLDAIPEGEANNAYSAGDVILVGYDEYVFDGTTWQPLGNESIYQLKADAETQHEALTQLVTDLSSRHDSEMDALEKKHDDELAALDAAYKKAITDLDKDDVAVEGQFVTAVSEADGVITVTRAALQATDIPVIEQAQVNGLSDALADKETTGAAAQALTDAKTYSDAQLKSKIESLDFTDTAVEKNVVTAVSETDGVIAVTRVPLANIAWSGEVKDLQQTDTVLVLDCGDSSEAQTMSLDGGTLDNTILG